MRCHGLLNLVCLSLPIVVVGCQTTGMHSQDVVVGRDDEQTSDIDGYGKIPVSLQKRFAEMHALTSSAPVDGEASSASKPALMQPGRYVGYVALPTQGAKAAAVLDLMLSQIDEAKITYQAILKVYLGGFQSAEYVSAYFPSVTYIPATQAIDFGKGGDFSLAMGASTAKGITGLLMHDKSEGTGDIELRLQTRRAKGVDVAKAIFPELPVLGTLSGNYVGQCADHTVGLVLDASKWRGALPGKEDLFDGFRVKGRQAQKDAVACGGEELCTKAALTGASYNFFNGQLRLTNQEQLVSCRQQNRALDCDGCRLEKSSSTASLRSDDSYQMEARPFHLPAGDDSVEAFAGDDDQPEGAPAMPPTFQQFSGKFFGYVHHEQTGKLQLLSLTLKGADDPDAAAAVDLKISGVATLYFGEGDSNEFIAYKFAQVPYVHGKPFQVLSGNGDGFMAVRSWSANRIVGEWYSKVFGRVGTVELKRDVVPVLSAELKSRLMQPISGTYVGPKWDYELVAAANVSDGEGDFYPLKIYGWAKEKGVEARRRVIDEGSFDFYSNALAFKLDDSRLITGTVDRAGPGLQSLVWPSQPRQGAALSEGQPQLYTKQPARAAKQAALLLP